MKKIRQNTYTCLLLATCFVASPFIVQKIWKTSAELKKTAAVAPPSVSETVPESDDSTQKGEQTENTEQENVSEPAAEGETPAEETGNPEAAPEAPTEAAAQDFSFVSGDASYFDDALFIGDSRTVGIKEYGTFSNADFFCDIGMSSGSIDSEYIDGRSFGELIEAKQYGKVYVMLGINEVGNDFQTTLTQYRAVIERLKAHQTNAIIVIQANLHVAPSAETGVINNERINTLNTLVAGLADNKKVFYLDINELYDDANGYLTEEYSSDGVHPLAMYYKQWCEWLCTKEIAVNTTSSEITEPSEASQPLVP